MKDIKTKIPNITILFGILLLVLIVIIWKSFDYLETLNMSCSNRGSVSKNKYNSNKINETSCNNDSKCNWNTKTKSCIEIDCNNIDVTNCNDYIRCSINKKTNKCQMKKYTDPCSRMPLNQCFYGDKNCMLNDSKTQCYNSKCINLNYSECKNNNKCMWQIEPKIEWNYIYDSNGTQSLTRQSYCRTQYDPSDCKTTIDETICNNHLKCNWNKKGKGLLFYSEKKLGACENVI